MTDLEDVLRRIAGLRRNTARQADSPHKWLFLLALARLYESDPHRQNYFPLTSELEEAFAEVAKESCDSDEAEGLLIEFPFYHLSSDDIWTVEPLKGRESLFADYASKVSGRLTRARILETVECGRLIPALDRLFRDAGARSVLVGALHELVASRAVSSSPETATTALRGVRGRPDSGERRVSMSQSGLPDSEISGTECGGNAFVGYLNSLIRLSGGNDGALAEFQALDPSFRHIHVGHPLVETVLEELGSSEGGHVILTGHAGDGKSTIAIDAYKRLMELDNAEPLSTPMGIRENLASGISIVKDLSERQKTSDVTLMAELLAGRRRFLLVSNTGALLDFFLGQSSSLGLPPVDVESAVLSAISTTDGRGMLEFGGARFLVLNLARIDNVQMARQIFERMIDHARWSECGARTCRTECPIYLNVDLINNCREIVLDRLFLAYRRMYEHGGRLTLRQVTEHLAYLITSGLEESDISRIRSVGKLPLKAGFMFFNRFFGDDGRNGHAAAGDMRAVQAVQRQGFGERPCPTWERRLWLKLRDGTFRLGIPDCDKEFDLLREHGAGLGSGSRLGMTPDQAREQVRRMLYFLYPFPEQGDSFLTHFLNSPMILRWRHWQRADARLEMTERSGIEQRVYHVLQEYFTGVRLPEGGRGQDRRLYVTLSRSKGDIRQSAQVVIAQVDWASEVALEVVVRKDVSGAVRSDLELQGRGRIAGATLELSLPFLDYVLMRHFGEVGETLEAAYVERLERFKTQIQELAGDAHAQMMLVRLRTDHTFRRQQYSVRAGYLEVNDGM